MVSGVFFIFFYSVYNMKKCIFIYRIICFVSPRSEFIRCTYAKKGDLGRGGGRGGGSVSLTFSDRAGRTYDMYNM